MAFALFDISYGKSPNNRVLEETKSRFIFLLCTLLCLSFHYVKRKGGEGMSGYVLAIDQGTTSTRAIVFDGEMNIVGVGQKEFTQIYPHSG